MDETYLIKANKLKPIWKRLGFSSEKTYLQSKKKYDIIDL